MAKAQLIRAEATVHLVGLGPHDPVWVDPDDPQIARWLRGGQLIRLDGVAPASPEGDTDATPPAPVPRETPRRRRAAKQ